MSLRLGNNIIAGVLSDTSAFATKTELNTKADTDLSNCTKPYIKTTYTSGTSGYRIWSDGYCEQWGIATHPQINASSSGNNTITFTKKFANANYNFNVSMRTDAGCTQGLRNHRTNPSADEITVYWYSTATTSGTGTYYWKASGYLASGQY